MKNQPFRLDFVTRQGHRVTTHSTKPPSETAMDKLARIGCRWAAVTEDRPNAKGYRLISCFGDIPARVRS